jgi:hypothetical protein
MKRKINTGIQGRDRDRERTQQTNVPRSYEVRDNDEEADFSYAAADRTERKNNNDNSAASSFVSSFVSVS